MRIKLSNLKYAIADRMPWRVYTIRWEDATGEVIVKGGRFWAINALLAELIAGTDHVNNIVVYYGGEDLTFNFPAVT